MKFVLATIIALSATAAFAGQEQYPTPLPSGIGPVTHPAPNSGAPDVGSEQYPAPRASGQYPQGTRPCGPDVGSEQYPTFCH